MRRAFIILLLCFMASMSMAGMDFGLRFKSHSVPTKSRTSLEVGTSPYKIDKEFKMGFFFNFYDAEMFGNIATLHTNNGHRVSIVTSVMDDGTYRLGLAVNDKLYQMKTPVSLNPDKEDHIDVVLNKAKNQVVLILNGLEMECPLDLSGSDIVTATFGADMKSNTTDVAPIDLRNIRIFRNGQNTNHWDFKYHNTPTTAIDDIGGAVATATNPDWLIDDHTDWKLIYSLKSKDRIQSTFNPVTEEFYIIDDDKIITFNPLTRKTTQAAIGGDRRVMAFSNHLAFNRLNNSVVNYNLNRRSTVSLTPGSNSWSKAAVPTDDEANYSNHAVALKGDTLYAFGGYGFYRYRNDLFAVNLTDGSVREIKLTPEMMPMTSSAAAVVGDKLYIFGGKGNESGRQELPSRHSFALYEYDMKTWKGKQVWKLDSVKHEFLPSQTMFYDPEEDCFYMAATVHGGQMLRISRTAPQLNVISTGIHSKMDFHDFVFDLYRSDDGKRYYLVIDKRLDPVNHDFAIYTISAPFITDESIINNKIPTETEPDEASSVPLWVWIAGGCVALICIAGVVLLLIRKRRKGTAPRAAAAASPLPTEPVAPAPAQTDAPAPAASAEPAAEEPEPEDFTFIALGNDNHSPEYFDRDKSSISFLGGFCVRDKEGNDITAKFTARLKHLLIMLLLSSSKYESGIKYQQIDEEIWGDKDEKSAQNNRNVSMRKLRLLLEDVGNVTINYDKGFFRIETNDVMFDYKELTTRIEEIKGADSVGSTLVNELLELLLMGPMLPNTTYDWLDRYKTDFSNSALEILTRLLKYELGRDDNLAYRIAETISLHDALNEEALFAKCQVLSRKKMLGLAKNIHAQFCKDYLKSMGENYTVSFADACKAE